MKQKTMENKKRNEISEEISVNKKTPELATRKDVLFAQSILVSSIILAGAWIYTAQLKAGPLQKVTTASGQSQNQVSALEEQVLPSEGITLPVTWGALGKKLVDAGVIDANKFEAIYNQRGTVTEEYKSLLLGSSNGKLKMTSANSGYLLNLLWALGLGNKNAILETGEMVDPAYGGAGKFASTGGWTIAVGNPMDHYSKHVFFTLTDAQQALVDKISRGIYRPCCGNSVHFPDCNHGMAMLGLLELMASQGVSEQNMWKTALEVNSYWFPNNYLTIATYMKNNKGIDWKNVSPQEMLGANYSSSRGYANIASQVKQPQQLQSSGSGCGVDSGGGATSQPQGGCGI